MATTRLEPAGDGVRLLTLTDPDRRNAMGEAMRAELISHLQAVSADSEARVLVVTGQGAAFCAGADLPALFGDPQRPVAEVQEQLEAYYAAFLAVRQLAIPTIAAVNGPAIGAGLNLALACDLRVAGPGAAFGATFASIGLHPGGGCTWFLVQSLGASRALRTLLLGDTIEADRAAAWGLAEGPEPDCVAASLELAGRIARVPPRLARHIKRGVTMAVETDDLAAVMDHESWAQAASAASPQLQEWVDRFRHR